MYRISCFISLVITVTGHTFVTYFRMYIDHISFANFYSSFETVMVYVCVHNANEVCKVSA